MGWGTLVAYQPLQREKSAMSKLTLMVCPHDTAKAPERWFRFVQYLNYSLNCGVHLEVSLDFKDFHQKLDQADLVYANPADTIRLVNEKGYTAIARPSNLHDEIVVVANLDVANPTLSSLQGAAIATVTHLLPTKIALHTLKQRGIEPGTLLHRDSWLSVVKAVWSNEASYGIVYKDTFDELSEKSKAMVNVLFQSEQRLAFHSLVLAPQAMKHGDRLSQALLAMNTSEQGKAVLDALQIDHWRPVQSAETAQIQTLLTV